MGRDDAPSLVEFEDSRFVRREAERSRELGLVTEEKYPRHSLADVRVAEVQGVGDPLYLGEGVGLLVDDDDGGDASARQLNDLLVATGGYNLGERGEASEGLNLVFIYYHIHNRIVLTLKFSSVYVPATMGVYRTVKLSSDPGAMIPPSGSMEKTGSRSCSMRRTL